MGTDSEIMQVFVRNVRARMARRAGLTVSELAREVGIARPVLSRVLNGRGGCTLRTAGRIADALGCDLAQLLSTRRAPAAARPA